MTENNKTMANTLEQKQQTFQAQKTFLMQLAYRITGSVTESEDILQEVFFKWLTLNSEHIVSPRSWLAKVTSNKALDYLKSARHQRENYVGNWLPEPFLDESEHLQKQSAANELVTDQTVSIALMLLLENLSSNERIAYVLHDIFDFNFIEIADMTGIADVTLRKQTSRARAKVAAMDTQQQSCERQHTELAMAFFDAVKHGEYETLCTLLNEDITLISDGGGKATAVPKPLYGRRTVLAFLEKVVSPHFQLYDTGEVSVDVIKFNGSPGLIIREQNQVVTAFQLHAVAGKVEAIYAHRNPDKLRLFQ